jgi:N-acetylglucosaminyldiphosphoundecaprenol N-acetyl-beta-D-mannosaminyltransferase
MNEATARKVNIIGTGISDISIRETVSTFNAWIDKGTKKRVCITPVNCLLWARENKKLREIYNSADLTLCDGVPLLWAAGFLKDHLKGRVTGLDLLPLYIEECYRRNYSMFFLGAKEGIAEALKDKYEAVYPGIQIKGFYSPPFADKFSDAENRQPDKPGKS